MADFMGKFMEQFEDQLKQSADENLKEYIKKYKTQLNDIESSNDKLMNKSIDAYHKQRESFATEMDAMINKKLAEAKRALESKLKEIDDEIFKDQTSLYQKIVASADELKQKQKAFETEKRKWNKDDKRIAEYLGISCEDVKVSDDDDEKEADAALKRNAEAISDEDHIVIKIDDRTFRTTRGTLTQVKGSFIAKLFGAHHDMMHRDEEGAYYLNCHPDTFAEVLDVLRKKGKVSNEFTMTHALYAALLQFEILNKFFPDFDVSSITLRDPNKAGYHVVFKSYRSTAARDQYFRWDKAILCSNESKEDDEKYWKLSANDDSEVEFVTTGWYRIVFRGCIYYSSHAYVQMQVNGSQKAISRNYGYSSNNYKSYNFNEIIQFTATQKLKFYASTGPYSEEQSSYLCIEKIPDPVVPLIGIYSSTSSSGNYRQWNSTVKECGRYAITNSNRNVTLQKGGLYRVSSRVHSNYSSGGQQYMYLYEYRNGGNYQHMSAKGTGTTGYECHMFDEICSLKKDDYLMMYDGGYGTVSSAGYDCLQIEYLPFSDAVGAWRSNSVYNTYQRKWDYEHWCNESLYQLDNNQSQIEIKKAANYRISSHVTQSSGSDVAGYSALYVNNTQCALARYGACGSTYQHTTTIQEIVQLKPGDKIYIYTSHAYNSQQYNSLFIEKLC